jgi:hypothetical protein
MTNTASEPTTAELLGIDKPPAPRSAGLAGLTRGAASAQRAPEPGPLPDFPALPAAGEQRLRALEEILRQAEGAYTHTVRAAKERFTITGGIALRMIRDEELWRDARESNGKPYIDFLAYAKAVWGYQKSHVYLLLDSVRIREIIKDKDAHLNTAHLKILGPAARTEGPEVVQRAWEDADKATDGKITGPALTKAITAAKTLATTGQQTSSEASETPQHSAVEALEAALAAQKHVWNALAPAAVAAALAEDPERTRKALDALEVTARRAAKRASNQSA